MLSPNFDGMLKAQWIPNHLHFKQPAGTSRGILKSKPTWFLVLTHQLTGNVGVGEVSIIPKLSVDDTPQLEEELKQLVERINNGDIPELEEFVQWPSLRFALETALEDLAYSGAFSPYPGTFNQGKSSIPINGLVWMGKADYMHRQIREKIEEGFECIKLKIGAIDFETELSLLKSIRNTFSPDEIEIRVDANGAFSYDEALFKLEQLSRYHIHSIEQPIRQNQWKEMAILVANSPVPIALDEELIGTFDKGMQIQMLSFIRPDYIILKPSLVGGIRASEQWIEVAQSLGIGWWATSALESNVGLNAIAQWVSHKNSGMPQGLGTGKLFTNNIKSPLTIRQGNLEYDGSKSWGEVGRT